MWSAGCNIHPYNHEFNLIFKAVRDNWPAKRCHDLDPDFVIEEAQEEEQKDPFNFKDIVPSFIGDESGPEFANEYGLLMVANLAKLKQQLVIFQLSINDTPSQLKGRAANDAKKARAATTRLANRKKGAEVEAAEAAAKMAKAASKTKKKPGRKNDVAEAEALAQAAQEKRNRRAPGVRPAYASTRC